MSRHIYLAAIDASADVLGAEVTDALRTREPDIRLSGVGGAAMAARGVASKIDMTGLSVLGFVDGIKAYGRVKKKVAEVADEIVALNPDAVVLIDSWGFMWRLAQALKLRGHRAKRIKLVGPAVWATRPGRAKVLAQWTDHLMVIHDFEAPFFTKYGLATTVIGNPALARSARGDGKAFRSKHGVPDHVKLVGLLLGSRNSEIRRVAPTLVEACEQLSANRPDRRVLCVVAPSVADKVLAMAKTWKFPVVLSTDEAEKADAFSAMDVALACSGTVTTELAVQGAPMVVGYKLGWITWLLARLFLWKSPYMSLLNVAAGREVAPEFLQTRFTPTNLARTADVLLGDPTLREQQRADQFAAIAAMAGPGRPAAEIAAETILRESAGGSPSPLIPA